MRDRFLATLCLLAFLMIGSTSASAQAKHTAPPLPAPVERTVYAPLVRSTELPEIELTLNSRSPHAMKVVLRIHDQSGNSYTLPQLTLIPHEVRRLHAADLLPPSWGNRQDLGGIFATYTGQWNEVAAQLTFLERLGW
jgi:hypothetical protein